MAVNVSKILRRVYLSKEFMTVAEIKALVFSRFVVVTVLAFTVIGAALAYGLLISYKSRSIVAFNGSITDFRILQEQVNTMHVFDRYVRDDKTLSIGGAAVRNHVVKADHWIGPVLRLNKSDAKELVGATQSARQSDLIGYQISSSSTEAESARDKVEFLVNYVYDASLKLQLDNYIADTLGTKRLLLNSALLERDTEAYNLSLLDNRFNDLKRLSLSYPASATASDRQILSIEKNGERYMPLPMQMIAAERERFDINEKLARTQRQVEGLPMEEAMLVEHGKIARKTNGGKALAEALIKDVQARMPNAKKGYETVALLGYENKYLTMIAGAFSPSRFIVSPTLAVQPVKSPLMVTVLFALLGVVLALLWQFQGLIRALISNSNDKEPVSSANESLLEPRGLHRA